MTCLAISRTGRRSDNDQSCVSLSQGQEGEAITTGVVKMTCVAISRTGRRGDNDQSCKDDVFRYLKDRKEKLWKELVVGEIM